LRYINDLKYKIDKVQTDKELRDLETKYKSKEKDNQLKINELEILNKDEELVSNKAKLYVLLGLFVVAVFMTLLISYFYTKTKNSNKQLQILSKQNRFLVSETYHRVNNNLQLIIVLISEELDKKQITDFDNSALNKVLIKVESIATLHRHLYKATDKKAINIEEYLNEIISNFDAIFKDKHITVNYKFDKINVSIDFAMYLGLLTTELFINSIKYAFETESSKLISLQVYKEEGVLHFNYTDNGQKTIGKEIYPNLVVNICKQIKANYKIETKSGFEIYVNKNLTDINGKS
jgi:two-component sensor histidine kinase